MPSWMRAVKSVETLEDGNFFGGFDVICFGYEVGLGNWADREDVDSEGIRGDTSLAFRYLSRLCRSVALE